ncbi:MAG: hypothetical protein AAGH60_15605 [Pseudomonadota bacterium]
MSESEPVGRLAMRVEGDWWVAYYAHPTTMENAVRLGSVLMALVQDQERKERFFMLMREGVSALIEEGTGGTLSWPEGPKPAPEHERAGRA